MDDPGIESWWRARFSASVQTGPVAHPTSNTMSTGSFPDVRRPGRGVDHPPPSSAEVKERVALYLYSNSGPSWYVIFFLSLNISIGWHLSPYNCYKPLFPKLYNCQLLCFCPLALSTAVQVFPRPFSKCCSFKDVYYKLVMPNCMPYS